MLNSQELQKALDGIAAEYQSWGKRDDYYVGPWLFTRDGDEWIVATEGHFLIAVTRACAPGQALTVPKIAMSLTEKWVPFIPAKLQPFSVSALRTFARADDPARVPEDCASCKNTHEVSCKECDGEGSADCECSACGDTHTSQCSECDGDGVITCPECGEQRKADPCGLLGRTINANILARILNTVAANDPRDVHVSLERGISSQGSLERFFLCSCGDGPRWMALVMPMADYVKPSRIFGESTARNAEATPHG